MQIKYPLVIVYISYILLQGKNKVTYRDVMYVNVYTF